MWKDLFKHCVNEVRGIMDNKADAELTKYIINKGCGGLKQIAESTRNILSDKKSRRAVGVVGMGLCIGLIASTYI